ncbi:hypothetical protein D3C78_1944920 [compost metagenome]
MQILNGGVHESQVRFCRFTRPFRIACQDRQQQFLVLFSQPGEDRRLGVHTLAAMHDGGAHQIEKAAHGLQQHHVV